MVGSHPRLQSETLLQEREKKERKKERNLPTFFSKAFVPALFPPTVTESPHAPAPAQLVVSDSDILANLLCESVTPGCFP